MDGLGSRPLIRAVMVAAIAAIIAGCSSAPGATASVSPPSLPPASETSMPEPTATPAATSSATPTASPAASGAVACAQDLPTTLASVEELADPSCYGATELTIDGWLSEIDVYLTDGEVTPSWTIALAGLFAQRPTVGESIFDFLLGDHRRGARISVVAPPESGIDLLGLGRWVTLRGHFNDPAASECSVLNWEPDPEDGDPEPPDLNCERLFVVSSLEALERPAAACPTDSPMTLATFTAADVTCFLGREVKLLGWEDPGEGFGGVSGVHPISYGRLELLSKAQLVARRWESGAVEHAIFPWAVEGSGIEFDHSDRKVVVTGILGHPASERCRPANTGWTWSPPDSWAQNRCMRLFVITEVRTRD